MMMTDRELLEAAAKASGNGAEWYSSLGMGIDNGSGFPTLWNPLTDDGDAMRLMVKLRLFACDCGDVVQVGKWHDRIAMIEQPSGLVGADPYAATRRAIVRAAAAIATEHA